MLRCARSTLLLAAICAALLALAAGPAESESARTERSQQAAADFLIAAQGTDGAWRSEVYGMFRDGPTLTALVVRALAQRMPGDERTHRGLDYLAGLVNENGEVVAPLIMPVYTAALAVEAFIEAGRPGEALPWVELLLSHQMAEHNGWSPSDKQFGGWGYSVQRPAKPAVDADSQHVDANLSATVFALRAVRCAEHAGIDAIDVDLFIRARKFIYRCQSYPLSTESHSGGDGGFCFTPIDVTRNKAGESQSASHSQRFHSYGSASADGYSALLLAGHSDDDPRVRAARQWLTSHFDAVSVPGVFNEDRQVLRDAYYFYYAWSVSLHRDVYGIASNAQARSALREQLLRRQYLDGSWANRFTDAKEDDPLIATAMALLALNALGGD